MTAHAYWRLNVTEVDGGASLALAEIELHTAVGGPNVATATNAGKSVSMTNRAANLLGSAALALLQNGTVDDAFIAVTLPFNINFLGVFTNIAYVGSNGYITFGSGSTVHAGNAANVPPIPAIQINALDRSYQRVYAGAENSGATFRIRYEGSASSGGTVGSPTVVWEVTFNRDAPTTYNIDIGVNAASGTGSTGISDGISFLAGFPNGTVNTGYNLTSTSTGDGSAITTSAGTGSAAFDSTNATIWQVTTITGWVQYQFNTPVDIVEHALVASTTPALTPKTWTLAYSDDGVSWTTACRGFAQTGWTSNQIRVFNHAMWPPRGNTAVCGYPQPIPGAVSPAVPDTKYFQTIYKAGYGNAGWIYLGTPASLNITPQTTVSRIIPVWAIDYRGVFANTGKTLISTNVSYQGYTIPSVGIPVTGTISGQVQEEGTPVVGRVIRLYYKPSGTMIASTLSDINGRYTFKGLEPGATKYVVTAYSPPASLYDAVIHDNITAL